ncbi:MAG: T9SS type A sorting domain-containing protein [Paludibacteraceae bacterium]|nr:T9SS type A sorting domain-containing protein [Paludibacteraceae bacterium]
MKKFYNNTIMSGALSKALRVLALLCVLLGVSSSAWGAATVTIYFDNTNTQWPENSIYLYMGHGSYSRSDWQMTKVSGNIFKCDNVAYWSLANATQIAFAKDQWSKSGANESLDTRLVHQGTNNYTKAINISRDDATAYIYIPTLSNGVYSLTKQDYANYTPACNTNATTIYFKNTVNWSSVYVYLYNDEYWDEQNGSGSNGIKAGPLPMTSCSGTGNNAIYKVEYPSGHSGYISFTKDSQKDYNNFHNTKAAHRGDLCGDKPMYVPSTTSNGTWNGTTYYSEGSWETHSGDCDGGGSGGDDDDDDTADCDGNNIEIWCRGDGAYTDMWCYAWNPDNDSQKPFGGFAGSQTQDKRMYDGHQWAVWTAEDYNKLSVIFSDGSSNCQTQDMTGLTKGNRYYFVLSNSWKDSKPSMTAKACGSSEEIIITNGTVYLDISKLTDWDDAGAELQVKVTYKSGESETLDLIQCALDANIFYVDQILNLANISKVQMLRNNPADHNEWNHTSELTFSASTPCVQLTGWVDGQGSATLTSYSGACGVESTSPVYITYDPMLSAGNTIVTMYGYLSETNCQAITEYGFVYCMGTATSGCTPTKNSPRLKADNLSQLYRGETFQHTATNLAKGYTYGYKAYAMIGDMMYLSDQTGYFTMADCTTRPVAGGDPINITVNAALGEDYVDDCSLTYGSLKTAIQKLKESTENETDYRYVVKSNNSYNLQQPVVINVHYYDDTPDDNKLAYIYRGTTNVGKYAGNNKPANSNLLDNFNYEGADPANTLTIKAGTTVAKPWVHHIVIRKSKNIVLDSLCIYSDPNNVGDNALEMDKDIASGDAGWHSLNTNGYVGDANILVQNCMIGSDGFTGMHISSYNGVTFKYNDFESVFDDASSNAIAWGASAKFMWCKNIKFIQNNFRGDHATLMWVQDVQDMLIMNNVFWNTNKFTASAGQRNPSAIRLVTQFGNKVTNMGAYYNTFYFANNGITSSSTYDFMSFAEEANIEVANVFFKYNNCYSYDVDCPGKSSNPFLGKSVSGENFCPNNFWSEYDQAIYDGLSDAEKNTYLSAFAFGCNSNTFINVKGEVCSTSAATPASLIVKGSNMNNGSKPTDDELLDFELTDDESFADRYYINVRPKGEGWTYGAYQSKVSAPTDTIYWVGLTDDWDDRNNWEYYTRKDPNDNTSPRIRQRVSCINTFSNNLTAIVEEIGSVEVSGGRKWPRIPDHFDSGRSNYSYREHVSAGLTNENNGSMFAKKIIIEYGAGIMGVENLKDGQSLYYGDAEVGFTAPRNQWILVGTVVKPYDEKLADYRNVKSGDYFVKDHLPHVYMHQAVLTDGMASWAESFTSLEQEVEPTTVFAIQVPDQYGKYKLPAAYYNNLYKTNYNPADPIEYNNFVGRFVNEEDMPNYTGLTEGTPVLLNNSYPANIDARELEEETGGTIQYYNYDAGTFMNTSATSDKVLLRPQHGFIFTPAADKSELEITTKMLTDGNTRSRSAEAEMPTFSLNLFNANTGKGYSNAVIRYDEFQEIGVPAASDVEKVFSPNTDVPELYIVANDNKYSRLNIGSLEQTIPLGVRLKQDMNIKFEKAYFQGFNNVTLVDTYTEKETDLLRNSYTTEALVAGDIEGRFYLNLEEFIPNEDIPEDDTTTKVDENTEVTSSINIFVEESDNTIRVITNGVELETIYVSDMAGKTMKYNVNGYAASLNLPIPKGVYLIQVIGDTASRTEKVILK